MRRTLRSAFSTGAPLVIYTSLSVAFFGLTLLLHGDRDFIGDGYDPQIFIWSLGWWPHAVLNGDNPFVTHAMWPSTGLNLAWVTAVPGLALLAAPVTLLAGPALAYNVVAVALPALAAWTGFLLCRYLTRSWWPSLAGGYLFGFSSYMVAHMLGGHINLNSVFLVPLVALTVLQYVDAKCGRRRLSLQLGLLLGAQAWLSTEVFATASVVLVTSLLVAFIVVPDARPRLRSAVWPVLAAFVVACVVAAPLLAYALADFHTASINDPALFPADLLNVVVPTETTFLHGPRALPSKFVANIAEHGAYLGLPLLVVVVWFGWQGRRRPARRLVIVLLAIGILAELGVALHVAGYRVAPLPWALAAELPALNNVLPVRFTIYVALAAAVAAALWAASPRPSRWVRVALVATAAATLLPTISRDFWRTTPTRPSFFADGLYRDCFRADETVFIPDPADMDATLWQAESGYRFRLANGSLSTHIPEGIPDRQAAIEVFYNVIPAGGGAHIVRLARELGATVIMLDARHAEWSPALEDAGLRPVRWGDLSFYYLRSVPSTCRP
jgi:hypothetical protein